MHELDGWIKEKEKDRFLFVMPFFWLDGSSIFFPSVDVHGQTRC